MSEWLSEVETTGNRNLSLVLVGNKCDLKPSERQVSLEEASAFAAQHRMAYVESSARTGANVQKIFMLACAEVNSRYVFEFPPFPLFIQFSRGSPAESHAEGCRAARTTRRRWKPSTLARRRPPTSRPSIPIWCMCTPPRP